MQPSSLIFLVIIGVWAAYFVEHWVRRREHLETARSVDAFSQTMRVLRRRDVMPQVDLSPQPTRSYAVSPARAARPQVTVKRAVSAPALGSDLGPDLNAAPSFGAEIDDDRYEQGWEREPAAHGSGIRPSRAVRGLTLLSCLAGTLVFAVLSLLGVLVGWAWLVPLTMSVGAFLWLRAGVQAEIAERARRRRSRPARREQRWPEDEVEAGVEETHAPVVGSPTGDVETLHPETLHAGAEAEAADDAPFDVAADDQVSPASAEAHPVAAQREPQPQPVYGATDEDDIPLTWDPRPVPRPTYAMKAAAHRRLATPATTGPRAEGIADDTASETADPTAYGASYDTRHAADAAAAHDIDQRRAHG